MSESPKNLVPKFFDNTALTYNRIVKYTTFGKDNYWKQEIIKQISKGNSFLDLACGTGILTRLIAKKFPNSKIIGIDITQSYLDVAKKNSSTFKNITYLKQDAEKLTIDEKFDNITSSYIPKYCDPKILVPICIDCLNPEGKIILHDFIYPKNKFVRIFWDFYFIVLNLLGYFIPTWKEAFEELPKLIRSSSWVQDYSDEMILNELEVKTKYLTWNSSAIIIGTKH